MFLAHDHHTHTDVAIKVLFEHLQRQPAIVEQFRREITVARRLAHPNIIQIYDLIETPDVLALVMEYAPGMDAKTAVLRHGPLPVDAVVSLMSQALSALALAHEALILHRDIKPHNLLIQKDDSGDYLLKIADLGLARVDDLISLSTHTQALGTIEYMAPEQLDSHLIDARADLYALGITAYELLTGKPPFTGPTPMSIAHAHQTAPRPLASHARAEVPLHLDAWIARAMAIHPHERFPGARAMREALLTPGTLRPVHRLEHCALCHAELIRGLDMCLECECPLELAVKSPGEGRLTLLMASTSQGRKVLTAQEQESILARLRADASCATMLRVDWNMGQLPVIVARQLTRTDGERLIRLLSTPHTQDLQFTLHEHDTWGLAYMHRPSLKTLWGALLIIGLMFGSVGLSVLVMPLLRSLFMALTGSVMTVPLPLFLAASVLVIALTMLVALGSVVMIVGAARTQYHMLAWRRGVGKLLGGARVYGSSDWIPGHTRAILTALRTPHTRALYKQLLSSTLTLHAHTDDLHTRRALEQLLTQSTLVAGAIAESERSLDALTRDQVSALDTLQGGASEDHERAHQTLRELDEEQRHMTLLTAELLSLHAALDELTIEDEGVVLDLNEEHAEQALPVHARELIEDLCVQLDATIETHQLLDRAHHVQGQ